MIIWSLIANSLVFHTKVGQGKPTEGKEPQERAQESETHMFTHTQESKKEHYIECCNVYVEDLLQIRIGPVLAVSVSWVHMGFTQLS